MNRLSIAFRDYRAAVRELSDAAQRLYEHPVAMKEMASRLVSYQDATKRCASTFDLVTEAIRSSTPGEEFAGPANSYPCRAAGSGNRAKRL